MLCPVRHTDPVQGAVYAFLALRRSHSSVGQRQIYILKNCEVADQVERLKDESNLVVVNSGSLAGPEICDWFTVELVHALCWSVEKSQDRQECRLPATGWT